ncbi:patatin-like phospholipase family protein [Aquabacterium sp.]|uniref:patatin-like phospholipase family protein n=1 Tax=Aquabacterium sp. TaxID=1872578 RepID=UPI0019CEA8D5|nr:patatin-like phospholipase family protein [Aquabacterium sp.]MBC7702114.1 patatin-like phospholipase family protein [Aquabacterium sp.]
MLAWLVPLTCGAQLGSSPASPTEEIRPRIGLVLSGGGARGLAHVGVLKVLERERIPVDFIAGTSMGAIVGGLYASGLSAEQIESEVLRLDWGNVFASRVDRRELSQRRKEQDFEVSPLIEVGIDATGLKAPLGTVSSRGLESHLRRMTLPSRQFTNFDQLPTPFRAVATDMETGKPVILGGGDLATVLRSSMSVPGVFAPVEVDGRILGDGGLVNNTPVDVARSMGAQRLIVVNIGTPLSKRDTLNSFTGVTSQMINILTEQNVQQSLRSMKPEDVLIAPTLDNLTAADFDRGAEFVALGQLQAEALVLRMQDLKLSEADYARWKARRQQKITPAAPLSFVRFEGSKQTKPESRDDILETRAGDTFDIAKAERDATRLAATGDYLRADYRLVRTPEGGEGLVFDLDDKPWGPNYLQIGLDFSADSRGRSLFNLKLVHNRHWLDEHGSEWRNFLKVGTSPAMGTEWYRPMGWKLPDGLRGFVSASASLQSRRLSLHDDPEGPLSAELERKRRSLTLDLGTTWRELGEVRLGWVDEVYRDDPDLALASYAGPMSPLRWTERGWHLSAVFDQLDHAFFPTHGWRVEGNWIKGRSFGRGLAETGEVNHFEAQAQGAWSWGAHTLSAYTRIGLADGAQQLTPRYGLGGFQQLSGYEPFQVSGSQIALLRLGYQQRVANLYLTRGLVVGTSLEVGNAWDRPSDRGDGRMRKGMSLYLGADTAFGPVYSAVVYSPRVGATLMIFVGRP